MKLGELQLEEAKAIFYAALGVMLVTAINMALKISDFVIIILSVLVMFGAYFLDEMERKFGIMKSVRRKE